MAKDIEELMLAVIDAPKPDNLEALKKAVAGQPDEKCAGELEMLWEEWENRKISTPEAKFIMDIAKSGVPGKPFFRKALINAVKVLLPPYIAQAPVVKAAGVRDDSKTPAEIAARVERLLALRSGSIVFLPGSRRWGVAGTIDAMKKKLQLDGFYRNICDTISVWFENGTHNEKTKLITDVLFDSGSFGSKENRMVADSTRDAAAGGAKKVRRKKLLHMLFPPCDVLSGRYPILEKLPILLPFMWVVRWVSAVLFRRKNIETQRNRMQSMSEDRVTSFEQSLKAVDLGFHFEE